jgi:hypothetical protein
VPEWFAAIIGRLLAKGPEDRFQTAAEVAEILEKCLAHVQQPLTVPLPPILGVATKRRRWRGFAVAGVLVTAVIASIALTPQTLPRESGSNDSPQEDGAAAPAPAPTAHLSHVSAASADGIDQELATARAHAATIEQALTAFPVRTGPDLVDSEIEQTAAQAQKLARELATPGMRK